MKSGQELHKQWNRWDRKIKIKKSSEGKKLEGKKKFTTATLLSRNWKKEWVIPLEKKDQGNDVSLLEEVAVAAGFEKNQC